MRSPIIPANAGTEAGLGQINHEGHEGHEGLGVLRGLRGEKTRVPAFAGMSEGGHAVTLVTDPADMDRDAAVHPWTRRLKYAHVEELLADYVAANAAIGRAHCPVADYFRAHLDDDILEVEAFVYAHPDWAPQALAETCHATLAFNNTRSHPHGVAIAAWAQHYCLLHLVRHHPYERARVRSRPC